MQPGWEAEEPGVSGTAQPPEHLRAALGDPGGSHLLTDAADQLRPHQTVYPGAFRDQLCSAQDEWVTAWREHLECGRDGPEQKSRLIPPLVFWKAGPPSLGTGVMAHWDISPLSECSSPPSSFPHPPSRRDGEGKRSVLLPAAVSDIKQPFCQVQGSSHLFSLFFVAVLIQQDLKHLLHPRVRRELNAQLCRERAQSISRRKLRSNFPFSLQEYSPPSNHRQFKLNNRRYNFSAISIHYPSHGQGQSQP